MVFDETVQLTKTFPPEHYFRGLEAWTWLDLDHKTPVFTSLFGDVFFASDSGYWFLDTLEGSLSRPWDDLAAMQRVLSSPEGQDEYLLGGLAFAAAERGIELGRDQVYDFTPPPVLGGSLDVENISAMSFVVALNIAGQIHDQVRDLPPGTPITFHM